MKILKAYQEAFSALPGEIRKAEVEAETEAELCVVLKNGVHSGSSSSEVTALFVRTLGEKAGFTYTQKLDESPGTVLLRAHESSLYSEDRELAMHEAGDGGCEKKDVPCELTDLSLLWEKAEEVDRWLAGGKMELVVRQIAVTDRVRTVGLVNTAGCDCCSSSHSYSISLFAADGRYPGSFFRKEYTLPELPQMKADIFSGSLDKWYWQKGILQNGDFAAGMYRCVLDASVMNHIFLTAWRMFTADNYRENTTPFAGKLDEKICSPAVTITDCVKRRSSGYVFDMDCEGSAGKNVTLVKEGVFCDVMSRLGSACGKSAGSTGNAGRKAMISGNIHTEAVTLPKNFGIEPGESSFEELIDELGNGIYIYESFDMFHSLNSVSGEYSIPCNGIVIEKGERRAVVKGLTINGRLQDLLSEIERVGNDVEVLPMLMLNSFTVSAPSVLAAKLSVSR